VDYENYPPTTIYWQIVNDGTSNDDFVAGEPGGAQLGNFQISGTGSTSFSWTTTEDLTTEGNENYLLQVGTFLGGTDLLNETLTITDTSITPPTPTYSLAPGGANNINEGSGLQFNVGGTDVPAGTYYWTIETGAEDFATTDGTVSVSAGTGLTLGSFIVTPTEDATTEGTEQFTVALRSVSITGDILASSGADINDTSLDPEPTYTLTPAADNVDEGSSLTFTVGGTDVPDGTYYWTIETNAGDFSTGSGEVSVTNSSGSFTVTPDTDTTTEGSETFTVSLRADSIAGDILVTSDSVTINDTSLTPEPTYQIAPRANNVNEGRVK
jgi:hypothetical protein